MWEVFVELCRNHGISPNKVARILGIGPSSFTDWKKGSTPRTDKLKKIADYFGVSVEYLMTGQEKSTPVQEDESAIDAALIAMLQTLPEDKIQRVKDFVSGLTAI